MTHGSRELSTTLQMPYPGILHLTHKPATCWPKTPLHIRALTTSTQESLRLTDLRQRADEDHEYQQLKHYIHEGFPAQRSELPDHCRRYYAASCLIEDGLIVFAWVSSTNSLHYAMLTSRPTSQCTPRVSSHKTTCMPWPGY